MMDSVAEPLGSESDLATPEGAVGDSLSVAVWTFISRFTGVLRGIVIAAVLGATYFANTYQFTNSLPNLIFYGLLAGSLFSSLLVPALVQHIDSGDRQAEARTAGGLLGVALVGMLALVPIMAVLTPWLLRVGSIGATDAAAARSQSHLGAVLVLLLLPQVPLYAVVGTATAVMNAHRRFALAAAAPALENVGTIAVLGVVAVLYSQAASEHHVPVSLLLLLGLGTTAAVLLHASTQWWGARRVGIVLVPNAGWRDPAGAGHDPPGAARGSPGGARGVAASRVDAHRRPGSRRRRCVPAGDELLLPAHRHRRHPRRAVPGAETVPDDRVKPGRTVPRYLRTGSGLRLLPGYPGGDGLRHPGPAAGQRDRDGRLRRGWRPRSAGRRALSAWRPGSSARRCSWSRPTPATRAGTLPTRSAG